MVYFIVRLSDSLNNHKVLFISEIAKLQLIQLSILCLILNYYIMILTIII